MVASPLLLNLLILLLLGCSTLSIEEMFAQASECGTGTECDELWAAYNNRIERIEERKRAAKEKDCPMGEIYVEQQTVGGHTHPNSGCMNRQGMDRWLNRY
jgi:hypothetical protein